ncbi:MAG TPA: glycerate kinase [Acidimicrobiales bacterium]|jgi:glycerate kinase|nr:glycerate kinase [Acidimicrobiales bacterium]
MILAAPDKFRGTVTARQASEAMARGVVSRGGSAHQLPLSDGGEGFIDVLDVLGGTRERVEVTGPLGVPTGADYLRVGTMAVLEMAHASGLVLAGGAGGNDPVAATTTGTGELIVAAARSLARHPGAPVVDATAAAPSHDRQSTGTVVVGLGGSATTDGGLGALRSIEELGGTGAVELVGACDVTVGFIQAAERFGPQKGANEMQVAELEARLRRLAERYEAEYGVDVRAVEGAGAAGGLGGAIVVLGGRLRPGYEVVTQLVGFRDALERSSLVVTGEGGLDSSSFSGKVVGSVVRDAAELGVPSLVIAGRIASEAVGMAERLGSQVVSLSERFGEVVALTDTSRCIEVAVAEHLDALG